MAMNESQLYDIQRDFISKAREILKHGRIGIFSSPTGTGKTLSLLFSLKSLVEGKKEDMSDDALLDELFGTTEKTRIFYVSRTHSQLGQVIQELKKVFECKSIVLGSRKLYCINQKVKNNDIEALNMQCNSLVKDNGCEYYRNFESLDEGNLENFTFSDLRKGCTSNSDQRTKILDVRSSQRDRLIESEPIDRCSAREPIIFCNTRERTYTSNGKGQIDPRIIGSSLRLKKLLSEPTGIHDIEDFIVSCRDNMVCPYYLSKKYSQKCELLFMPYNLLFSKDGRRSLDIKLENSIIIVDEAHNLIETIIQMNTATISRVFIENFKSLLQNYIDQSSSRFNSDKTAIFSKLIDILVEFEDFLKVQTEVEPESENFKENRSKMQRSLNSSALNNQKRNECKKINISGVHEESAKSNIPLKNLHPLVQNHKDQKKAEDTFSNSRFSSIEVIKRKQDAVLLHPSKKTSFVSNQNHSRLSSNVSLLNSPSLLHPKAASNNALKMFSPSKAGIDVITLKRNSILPDPRPINIVSNHIKSKINHRESLSNSTKVVSSAGFVSANNIVENNQIIAKSSLDRGSQDNERFLESSEFLLKTGIFNYDIQAICEYAKKSKIVHKIGLSDRINEFFSFIRFLELINESDSSGRVFFDKFTMRFTPLDAQLYFEDILKCRSLILAGGTMEPIDELVRLLYRESDPEIFSTQNLKEKEFTDHTKENKPLNHRLEINLENKEYLARDNSLVRLPACKRHDVKNDQEEIKHQIQDFDTIKRPQTISCGKNSFLEGQKITQSTRIYSTFSRDFRLSSQDIQDISNRPQLSSQSDEVSFNSQRSHNQIVFSHQYHRGHLEYHSYSHVCKNYCAQIVTKGPTNFQLVLNYKSKTDQKMIKEYMLAFSNYTKLIKKGGIVCFVPSSSFIEIIRANLPPTLSEITLFDTDCNFEYYKNTLQTREKAILFSVMGGKLSEGINFSDEMCRLLIIFGIPYPTKTLELSEREKFHNRNSGINDYQTTVAMKAVNQAIGRAIRHKKDYSGIILLDSRYAKIKKFLSRWVQDKLVVSDFQNSLQHLIGFFKTINC